MGRRRKTKTTAQQLQDLADRCGMADNPLWQSAAENYYILTKALKAIEQEIDGGDTTNLKRLSGLNTSANNSLVTMLKLIQGLGTPEVPDDALADWDETYGTD